MKTIKVSEFADSATCPECKEYVGIIGEWSITDGDVIVCPFCKEKIKVKII